ncbi:ligand-binding sensor domain-containing protein [Dysgonomonas macrotermitis]|nr:two-component regulator propeller domain-containing protein [Dysgonomonas macrotermitis]
MAQIYRVFQDSEGYMWYGTEGGGLCRDDGYTVTVFRSDFHTPRLLESNWITCITEDNEHKIWFGTKRGLYILDKKDYSITSLEDKEIERWAIDAILSASDGTLWVSAGNRLFRYDADQKRLDSYTVRWNGEFRSVSQIYEDNLSDIWIVQWRGGLFRFDMEKNDFVSCNWPFEDSPTYIMKDHNSGSYWISTWGKGIVRFDPGAENHKNMFSESPAFYESDDSRRYINGMAQDSILNYLWTITTDNLYIYKVSVTNELYPVEEPDILSSEKKILNQIISDKAGNIWVPAYYPHTFIVSFHQNQAVRYTVPKMEKNYGYPASPVSFVYDDGDYWFFQRRTGLYLCNSADNGLLSISELPGFKGKKISPLLEQSKNGNGIFSVANDTIVMRLTYSKTVSSEYIISLPYDDRIHTLHEDSDSNLWIGTSNNLFKYDLRLHALSNVVRDIGIVNDIVVASDGKVFLATEKQGLCIVQPDDTLYNYHKEENFSILTEAPNFIIWAGTQQGNVYYYAPGGKEIVSVTKDCALNGDAILAIEADNHGYIWILTDQRIVIYDPVTKSTNVVYNSDPSVLMNNFLSLYKDEKGIIHVGGTDGFCSFPDYDRFNTTNANIPVKLSSIKVNGDVRLTGYSEEVITLQPKEQNIELFFSTPDHLNAKNIRYAFRYNEEKEYWNYLLEGQNNIFLTGLAKGEYVLYVKATDKNGYWGDNSIKIVVRRLPAWYETTFAYVIYIFIIIAIICIVLYYYSEWKKRKLIDEQIHNSAKDLQELVSQLSENTLTPAPAEGLNLKDLLVSMQKILQRQKEQKDNSTDITPSDEKPLSLSDEKFIQRALDYVEQNIDNSDYSVEQLSKDLGMERTGLYRKLGSIIDKTPTSFIRSIRLKRAARLLEEGCTVSEAADRVGFGTSSYLSRCFQEEFGIKPSQYIASFKQRKKTTD